MIDQNYIRKYIESPEPHEYKEKSEKHHEKVKVHITDDYSEKTIGIARPNEDQVHKKYRETVFENVTKTEFNKISTVLKKIRRAEDFRIKFDEDEKEVSNIREYVDKNFPVFHSILNWFFNYAMDKELEDSNAIAIVYPRNWRETNEVPKPYPYIFHSKSIFRNDGEMVIVKKDGSTIIREDGKTVQGECWIFTDKEEINFVEVEIKNNGSNNESRKVTITTVIHNFDRLPVINLGGKISEMKDGQILYKSIIEPCLGYWREALRRYSDHQINMVNHVHPESWQVATDTCKTCRGTGRETIKANSDNITIGQNSIGQRECSTCGGSGYNFNSTPGGRLRIKPIKTDIGGGGVQMPSGDPIGYVNKPIDGTEFIYSDYVKSTDKALDALNLSFLNDTPLNQSGTAKDFDRQEINTLFYEVAAHFIVNNIAPVYIHCIDWLYINETKEARNKLYPSFNIPQKYDVLSSDVLRERATTLKKEGFSPFLVARAQEEYYKKEYGTDSIEYKIFIESLELDPLFGVPEEARETRYMNNGCTQEDFIISTKLHSYIRSAVDAEKDFFNRSLKEKKTVLSMFAQLDIAEINKNKMGGFINEGEETTIVDPDLEAEDIARPDLEAEAKAKLKGSVGGVQGILDTATKVTIGEISKEAAINILLVVYGYDRSTAERMLISPPNKDQPKTKAE